MTLKKWSYPQILAFLNHHPEALTRDGREPDLFARQKTHMMKPTTFGLLVFFCHWTNSGRVLLVCNEEDEKVIGGNLEDIIHSQEFKWFQWLTGRKVPGDLYHVMPCHETRWSHGCVSFCFSSGEAWNKVLKYLSTQESSWVPWIFRDYIWSHLSDPKVPI